MIKTYITLDYELFFGNSGTVENTIIKPTNDLLKVLDKYKAKAVFFVDIGFIIAAEKYQNDFIEVKKAKEKVIKQIQLLVKQGHQIQLHIHSHWEDAYYDNRWFFPMQNYRLHTFKEQKINEIVKTYKNKLEEISKQKITVFRAGGWCLQPFKKLRNALKNNNIKTDSTVFKNGQNLSGSHYYDFKNTPNKTSWKFLEDPTKENLNGDFTEIPIASFKVSPFFFWKFAFIKKLGSKKHKQYGDGSAVKNGLKQKLRLLFSWSNTVVSIDGYKSKFLQKAFNKYIKNNKTNFVIIGHPKAFTPYSLTKLDQFLKANKKLQKIIVFKNE